MTGLPWSCSAHAKDIWTIPAWEKRDKLRDLDWLVTCTAIGRDHLVSLGIEEPVSAGKVALVYHGLDLERFPPPADGRPPRDGRDPKDPLVILSVGRAVAKKGYPDLLRALAGLPADLHWRLVHIGGGDLAAALKTEAERLGLADRIEWRGPQPQDVVLAAYREADVFALASRIADDGDRDGLPNVLMEAQSQELACLATKVSAIPELIRDGETGLLVPPQDPTAMTAALIGLIQDPQLRTRLGTAGAKLVRRDFSMERSLDLLADRLAPAYPAAAQ
jgi:glycosyltransferase involved in cell wall biosynthesis